MRAYDFDCVVHDGEYYCVTCLPKGVEISDEEVSPVFASEEVDGYPCCAECGRKHTYMSLTCAGVDYELRKAAMEVFYMDKTEFVEPDSSSWMFDYLKENLPKDATEEDKDYEAENLQGYYYWCCLPGCLPEGEPIGPYSTEETAKQAALDDLF